MSIHFPGIAFNEADGQILLVSQPVEGRPTIDSTTLHALLIQEGYGDCQIDAVAVDSAAKMCNVQETSFGIEVAKRFDAQIQVHTSHDDMTAMLTVIPPMGGKAVTQEAIMQALSAAGVVFGIDETAIEQVCQLGSCSSFPVAAGAPPVHGVDATFDELIEYTVNREPKLDENGLIDYRERGEILTVQVGAALMRRTPATLGVAGHTVKGRVLAAHAGRDKRFGAAAKGAEVSAEDADLLVAAVSGQPVRVDCGVMIEPILNLKEVNMATGNIHFDGNVHITGEVVQGMTVKATGDIVVNGMVDSGTLEAGGDIQISGGVIARAKLRAGGAVSARFAEGVRIEAGTVISLKDMALECELHSLNQIIIGSDLRRGRLIGGSTTAMLLVRVGRLGSDKAGTTRVVVAMNPELDEKYAQLQARVAEEEAAEVRLSKLVKHLQSIGDPQGVLERAKASWQHAVQAWSKSLAERTELEKELALMQTAKVEIGSGADGAIDLSIGKLTARLRSEFGPGVFALGEDGHMVFTGAQGTTLPLNR